MLLVRHDEPQIVESYVLGEQRVRADHTERGSIRDLRENRISLRLFHAPLKQHDRRAEDFL